MFKKCALHHTKGIIRCNEGVVMYNKGVIECNKHHIDYDESSSEEIKSVFRCYQSM
ncbi:MAG: hypothetical protein WCK26_04390 [Candidatus Saccharibacteria bacterium]